MYVLLLLWGSHEGLGNVVRETTLAVVVVFDLPVLSLFLAKSVLQTLSREFTPLALDRF